jgi:four helix bundle protein
MTATNSAPLRAGAISASRDYAELPAWQKAIALAEQAYNLSKDFDAKELKREFVAAATRIATHIAAASGKPNEQGILNCYFDAQAAAAELDTVTVLAQRLGELKEEDAQAFQSDREAIARLLAGMRHGLKVEVKDEKRKEREVAERDREHAERKERFDRKPKRDFDKPRGDRERPDREERQYKPRGEYKPRTPREDGEREYKPRRDFGDKPRGDKKPYGDRKPRGKSFGDKKPYGDKPRGGKSFGDKPFKKGPRRD